ncbi:MurR/RpiR family transcriptional regulator [Celerinatantimonas sp. MCCC 1A17872]|uniref:MurR/RpiR family transcriptional regulator n=1 Tax=Celerinatantimonas sp. MCCC 1A17872 TaxID=3177514 RepID=UPI0038CA663F
MPTSELAQRISACLEQLSPKERLLADFLLTHEAELAMYSSADMARLAKVSKPVVSRFFKRLGYDGFSQAREALRRQVTSGAPQFVDLDEDLSQLLNSHFAQEQRNLQQTLNGLQSQPLEQISHAFKTSKRVFLFGLRNSYPVALHWREQLIQMRENVHLFPQPGQTISEEVVDLTDSDLVVVIALRRRAKVIKALMRELSTRPVKVLLVTDPSGLALTTYADWTLPCHQLSSGGFASYASAMALVSVLCNICLESEHKARIEAIDAIYQQFDELESTQDR